VTEAEVGADLDEDLERAARSRLGIRELLPEQREAIGAAAAGRDALVVMPTGSGKSAIYQLAGELRPGPTVVVTPLLALQHDQLRSIREHELSRAEAVNSLQARATVDRALRDFVEGRLEFLFLAPEQLRRPEVLEVLARGRPSLFVVDEAHCVSTWGHDFRPDYLALAESADALGRPPVIALTASAAPPVREDIAEHLGLVDPVVVLGAFDRPELDLAVRRFTDLDAKVAALLDDAREWSGPAIVYVATRRTATRTSAALQGIGVVAETYHGGLARRERERIHHAFLDGSVGVVVATNAFGMGIDKPDVRTVAHLDVPGSVDAYYQEIGRGGRDGQTARAQLYYRPEDLGLQRFFRSARIDEHVLAATFDACTATAQSLEALTRTSGCTRGRVRAALDLLQCAGAVRHGARGWKVVAHADDGVVERAQAVGEAWLRAEQSRVDMMRTYAETTACRRVVLLGYYGEDFMPPCGGCDNCRDHDTTAASTSGPFRAGQHVEHVEWGPGTVMTATGDRVVVWFADHGYRTLLTELVVDRDLLELSEA
jgi:ATP-dependent DNA helicase RecQ